LKPLNGKQKLDVHGMARVSVVPEVMRSVVTFNYSGYVRIYLADFLRMLWGNYCTVRLVLVRIEIQY